MTILSSYYKNVYESSNLQLDILLNNRKFSYIVNISYILQYLSHIYHNLFYHSFLFTTNIDNDELDVLSFHLLIVEVLLYELQ